MIASPGDVAEERAIVTEQLYRWNHANASARQIVLLPVKWETHSTPQLGAPPQTIINNQLLHDVDIMIGIFGTRIGTPTEEYISGSVEEIKKHVAAGKTAKVYFSDVPVSLSAVDPEQYASVRKFREECQSSGLYATYKSIEQFRTDFGHHLDLEMNQPRYLWLASLAPVTEDDTLSEDALTLLTAAAQSNGDVMFQFGTELSIGGQAFTDGSPRSLARWQSAVQELLKAGALRHVQEDFYRVTASGYKIADGQKQAAASTVGPFDQLQRTHVSDVLASLNYIQRDFLRFLLLKGGTARGDVVFTARANDQPLDLNSLTRHVLEKGLATQTEDRMNGYSTFAVNERMAEQLKGLLFPREEGNDTPFFNGIPVPKSV